MAVHKTFTIAASPEDGWTILQDVALLAGCFPGGEIVEKVDDNNFIAIVKISIGPITMFFDGKITIDEKDDQNHTLSLTGSGQDSKGTSSAEMKLKAKIHKTDTGFNLVGDAKFKVSGKLAAFGSRMIGQVADQLLNQFGVRYQDHVLALSGNAEAKERLEKQPQQMNAIAFGFNMFINMIKGWFK